MLLNWVDVSYESLYRARNNTLYFNTAVLSGDTSITVTGLDDTLEAALVDAREEPHAIAVALLPGHVDGHRLGQSLHLEDAGHDG